MNFEPTFIKQHCFWWCSFSHLVIGQMYVVDCWAFLYEKTEYLTLWNCTGWDSVWLAGQAIRIVSDLAIWLGLVEDKWRLERGSRVWLAGQGITIGLLLTFPALQDTPYWLILSEVEILQYLNILDCLYFPFSLSYWYIMERSKRGEKNIIYSSTLHNFGCS